ncbi:MAG: hypothetical protein Q7S52_04115 [bacterium]|nr:hypothetical protein [bacterium]
MSFPGITSPQLSTPQSRAEQLSTNARHKAATLLTTKHPASMDDGGMWSRETNTAQLSIQRNRAVFLK